MADIVRLIPLVVVGVVVVLLLAGGRHAMPRNLVFVEGLLAVASGVVVLFLSRERAQVAMTTAVIGLLLIAVSGVRLLG